MSMIIITEVIIKKVSLKTNTMNIKKAYKKQF